MSPALMDKLRAGGIHFALSALWLLLFTGLVLLHWFPGGLFTLQGGWPILVMMIGIDVVLGPVLTLLVFRRGKKTLRLDLCVIVALQLVAFGYGAWAISTQRPAYLAFLHDRFFVVTERDLLNPAPDEIKALQRWKSGPTPVFVRLSFSAQMEAMTTVPSALETPAMGLLPEGYAPLVEGKPRYVQLAALQAHSNREASILRVPVIGRDRQGTASLDIDKAEILGITLD